MKFLKIILPIVVVIAIAALGFWLWKLTDHTEEFSKALYSGNISAVEALLEKHPSLANAKHMERAMNRGFSPVKAADWSPMHVAALLGDAQMVKLLARYHANPNARDKRGLTPLLWTAFGGKRDAAEALIDAGADINARGLDGRSTLDLAKLSLDDGLVEILRQHGAKE